MWLFTVSASASQGKHSPGMCTSQFIIHIISRSVRLPEWNVCERELLHPVVSLAKDFMQMLTRGKLMYFFMKLRLSSREVMTERQQNNLGKLMVMRQEYERYKDLWGTNLHYSHSAGPSQNYSELDLKT